MARIRYLVMRRGRGFHVYRESQERGASEFRTRAERFAATLAALECSQFRVPTGVWTEQQEGVLSEAARFDPPL